MNIFTFISFGVLFLFPQDGPDSNQPTLGSTATLEELQIKPAAAVEDPPTIIDVLPASEPVPALKYRLYPKPWELKDDSALFHLNRAFVLYLTQPAAERFKWSSPEWQRGEGEDVPSIEQIAKIVESNEELYRELHALAMSRDFEWDHRIRDASGVARYEYRLDDVQEVRHLSQMLVLKLRVQRANKDFEGAIGTLRDGFRLAAFVGQGETVVQCLISISVQSMMIDQLRELIATPGCPNLYWAIASIPRPLSEMRTAIVWELDKLTSLFPTLLEATGPVWTEQQATEKWAAFYQNVMDLQRIDRLNARFAFAMSGATGAVEARKQLIHAGIPVSRVNKLLGVQAVLQHCYVELNTLNDQQARPHLLPDKLRYSRAEQGGKELNDYFRNNHGTVPRILAGFVVPPVFLVANADLRLEMYFNRLLTLEALRRYAADHNRLPESLNLLGDAPAFPDPFSWDHFEYQVQRSEDTTDVILNSAGNETRGFRKTLKARVKLPTKEQ